MTDTIHISRDFLAEMAEAEVRLQMTFESAQLPARFQAGKNVQARTLLKFLDHTTDVLLNIQADVVAAANEMTMAGQRLKSASQRMYHRRRAALLSKQARERTEIYNAYKHAIMQAVAIG